MAEFESEFLILIKRVTGISESLLKSFYIYGLKPLLQCALLRLAPTTLREAFSITRIMEARFETITGKKLNIEEKIDIVLSWPSEEAPPVIKGSLDVNEDIGVVKVSSAIDDVFDIGESNVESMEVRIEFSEVSENKKSMEEVVGGGEALEIGEDDDLGDATTDGGDDAVESGDISILNSLIGHGSPRSLQLWGKIDNGDVHMLIDKGSTHNFIRPDVAEKLCLRTHFTKKGGFVYASNEGNVETTTTTNSNDAQIQRRLWDPGIKIFFRHHLEDKVVVKT
nr:hypothetical protein [Tanacetum cinerariifolium]